MTTLAKTRWPAAFTIAFVALSAAPAHAELTAEELAKLAQNPVGNMISVPFQNNTNLNFGPEKRTQNILNIQPVIPFEVNKDWNIITRTIAPIVWMPALGPDVGAKSGLGDIQFSALLISRQPGAIDLGRRAHFSVADQQQCGTRQQELGIGARVCHLAPRARRSMGLRRHHQQHLVAHQQQAGWLV